MKQSQIFLFSVLFCAVISVLSTLWVLYYSGLNGSGTPVSSQWTANLPTQAGSVSDKLQDLESGVKALAVQASPSVVSIVVSKEVQTYRTDPFGFFYEPAGKVRKTLGGGTGFFISKDGYILTNKHVVSDPNAEYSVILSSGKELIGKILAYDPTTDLAVMRAYSDANTPYNEATPLSFVPNTGDLQVGSFVVAIGNALAEFQNTLTFGVVSGLGRSIQAENQLGGNVEALSGLIQTDTAINPGNSGGPLLNLNGKVVGINTAVSQGANGIGFAIPLSDKIVTALKSSVIKYGTIKRSFLGVRYIDLNNESIKRYNLKVDYGAYIPEGNDSIVPSSPAEKAGLSQGDVILEVNGQALKNGFWLKEVLAEKLPGETIKLRVLKKSGKIEETDVVLSESPNVTSVK